ncbi:glycosyltransferase family 4 protein [Chamaesiphon minutus]|uniref:Glycosyltransferase n=1 Tax=Chamaesiphon minutus (strain ATCC 27169 / PCC 6605) TaxID=1173020 RepID=K9UGD9_CHAP6|nr:glycosyltransferase family 4 protein [Chamaesiphon minutus]AFY93870.1 glycosyltransferase [Chamaesiphon minutus PCC 6605]
MLDAQTISNKPPDRDLSKSLRIALLFPTVELGNYWQPVLKELADISERVMLYTGRPWAGFDPNDPENIHVEVVGKTVRVNNSESKTDYSGGYMMLSPRIIGRILAFKPQVVIACGFSIWTMLAIIFKPIGRWRVILAWDGSSPNVDFRNSKLRLWVRATIARFVDRFITNSEAGKAYFCEYLGVEGQKITVKPYLVPDPQTLSSRLLTATATVDLQLPSPIFLYVGRLEERKGVHLLLQACHLLRQQSCQFSLAIAGRGPQQDELQAYCHSHDLDDCVEWLGWIDYRQLGAYFQQADILVFPSLEDIWGMVTLEAMAFGKPVLASKWAGSSELIVDGQNGWLCDPHDPTAMAAQMRSAIDRPALITTVGKAAAATLCEHTPQAVARFLARVSLQSIDGNMVE